MDENTREYIDMVSAVVQKYRRYATLTDNEIITPDRLNGALANYGPILFTLTSEYQRKKAELISAQREFDMWWDERFVATRREINTNDIAGTKWLSKQELESETRVRNKEEFREKRSSLDRLERELSLYRQLVEGWKKIDNLLINLSLNMRSELRSLSIEDRANSVKGEERAQTRVPSARRPVS